MTLIQNNYIFETEHGTFELIFNFKDAFDKELFLEKYVDLLSEKHYIVGDIAYDKLRLSGFITTKDINHPKNINNLQEYILEYCNLGAPFFVLRNVDKTK